MHLIFIETVKWGSSQLQYDVLKRSRSCIELTFYYQLVLILIYALSRYYILRPETFEAYFYMWRLTKDKKYRYTSPFEKYFGLGIIFLGSDLQNYSDESSEFGSDHKTM